MDVLKAMSRSGFLEMLLLGLILAAVTFGMDDVLTANPDRVSKVLGSVIGLLLARGLGGVWQVYRATRRSQAVEAG
jgi:hypothetical protein